MDRLVHLQVRSGHPWKALHRLRVSCADGCGTSHVDDGASHGLRFRSRPQWQAVVSGCAWRSGLLLCMHVPLATRWALPCV